MLLGLAGGRAAHVRPRECWHGRAKPFHCVPAAEQKSNKGRRPKKQKRRPARAERSGAATPALAAVRGALGGGGWREHGNAGNAPQEHELATAVPLAAQPGEQSAHIDTSRAASETTNGRPAFRRETLKRRRSIGRPCGRPAERAVDSSGGRARRGGARPKGSRRVARRADGGAPWAAGAAQSVLPRRFKTTKLPCLLVELPRASASPCRQCAASSAPLTANQARLPLGASSARKRGAQ